jgi:two-component system, NtrC family, nitrogen regulation sensor histidine kinase NtrY
MRLRTTLTLAFIGLSLLQVFLVVPVALRNVNTLLNQQHTLRMNEVDTAARASLDRRESEIQRAMNELMQSAALEEVARDAAKVPPPPSVTQAARALMAPRGLSVLAVLDEKGRTLSSGHFPARLFEEDPGLWSVTQKQKDVLVPQVVDLPGAEGVVQAPALVTARAVDYGDTRVWVVGGVLLDQAFVDELSKLVGTKVEVVGPTGWKMSSGFAASPTTTRILEYPPAAEVRLVLSRAGLRATAEEIVESFLLLAATGGLLALVLGMLVSRRITRPVEALTEAARRLGSGQLDATVTTRASGEVRTLVETFNRMMGELKTTTDKLVASERVAAWQEVARRLAHEVKNPLTPIRMSLETLLAWADKDPARTAQAIKDSAPAVLEEVERLRRIVDEFSRFARLPKPELAPLDLSELAGQVLSLYSERPVAGPGSPVLRYQTSLPKGLRVRADKDQLTQVLVNLVKNAEEAMAATGGTVRVSTVTEGSSAVLRVADEGPGVPEENRSRLFEPYVTTKSDGTGLGLAIAARICQEHQGSLSLDDAPKGATFAVRLPLDGA